MGATVHRVGSSCDKDTTMMHVTVKHKARPTICNEQRTRNDTDSVLHSLPGDLSMRLVANPTMSPKEPPVFLPQVVHTAGSTPGITK